VARDGEDDTPAITPPSGLRPFLRFAKLPAPAMLAARRAVDADEEFRLRVAEAVSEADVGRAGWLWLTRPEGWEQELEAMASGAAEAGEAAADRRAENEARRRLAGAEAATQRAEAAAASAQAESARAVAALAEERRARRAAADHAEDLARRLEQATSERDQARTERDRAREEGSRARRRVAELGEELEELRNNPPTAPAPAAAVVPEPEPTDAVAAEEVRRAGAALLDAAEQAAGMAGALRLAAEALGAAPPPAPAPAPQPVAPTPSAPPVEPPPRRPRPPRRVPASLPPGVLDDSLEAADHLFRVPGIAVLVDGYNASKLGWFELPIAEQRRRLVDALTELAIRTGADISIVFDGADPVWPASVPTTARVVKVSFSPADVEADDVILARVADIDPSRPVLVTSSDRRVQDGAAALGANVISSALLLAALRR
jgi:predicted RNA-binding protein with PIN domain